MKYLRILSICGLLAFLVGEAYEYYAMIPDARRTDFKTQAEQDAYDEGWKRSEMHIELSRDIYRANTAIFKYSLLVLSVSVLAITFKKRKKNET